MRPLAHLVLLIALATTVAAAEDAEAPASAGPDQRVIGRWKGTDPDSGGTVYLTLGADGRYAERADDDAHGKTGTYTARDGKMQLSDEGASGCDADTADYRLEGGKLLLTDTSCSQRTTYSLTRMDEAEQPASAAAKPAERPLAKERPPVTDRAHE